MKSNSAKYGAWAVSIVVHLVVLALFGIAKFSNNAEAATQKATPTAKVSRIEKIINAEPVTVKPKIKKRFTQQPMNAATEIFDTSVPDLQTSQQMLKPKTKTEFAAVELLSKSVEFFGSVTCERKICYLVDCSGSMHGIFRQVRKKMKNSISTLQFDQYFYIIFFGNDKLFEFGNGKLIRATQKNKTAAYDFIDSIGPSGQTNAFTAIKRAMQIHDSKGKKPSLIYFLTDGFELTAKGQNSFIRKMEILLRKSAPQTKINTIGFQPLNNDRKMLETIAKLSNGRAAFITNGNDNENE